MAIISGLIRASAITRALGRVTDQMPGAVKRADAEIARTVAERASAQGSRLGGVHGHVAGGIMAAGGTIVLDASGHPAILGAEFGGGARPTTRQFPPWTSGGYMVWPELDDDDVVDMYQEALDGLF